MIYLAKTIGYPNFFISGIPEGKQMVTRIELFSSREDAQEWVNERKSRYSIKSSRVKMLSKNQVVSTRQFHNIFEVRLKVTLGMMGDFKETTESFPVRCIGVDPLQPGAKWLHANLSPEVISHYEK